MVQVFYLIPLPLGVPEIFPVFCNQKEMGLNQKIQTKLYFPIISAKRDVKEQLLVKK